MDAVTAAGLEFLATIFEEMDLDIDVAAAPPRDDERVLTLSGDLETLNAQPGLRSALTLLTGQAMSRAAGEPVRCLLDVGGDFDARRALLEVVAADVARAVRRSRRRAVLDGLSSSERRVVHSALSEEEGVATRSEGGEERRLLLVEAR